MLQIEAIQIGHWVQQQAPANPCVGFKLFTFPNQQKPWNPKTLKPKAQNPKAQNPNPDNLKSKSLRNIEFSFILWW